MGSLFKISSDTVVNQRVLIEPLGAVWGESRARINNSRDAQLPPLTSEQAMPLKASSLARGITFCVS